jgi:hypothetical protein
MLTGAAAGLWLCAWELLPQVNTWVEWVSSVSCRVASLFAGSAVVFGPTYSGVPILVSLLGCHLSIFAQSRPRRPWLLLVFVATQCGLLLGYQTAFHLLVDRWSLESPWVILGASQLGLLLSGAWLPLIQLRYSALEPLRWQLPRYSWAWFSAATFLVFICVSDSFSPLSATPTRPRVLLYDDGYLDWSVPVYGQYSGLRGGMFGALPLFLQRRGCEAWRGGLTDGDLNRANVLVVFNLMRKFSPAEKRRIWDFVGQGGSLLAVGDHTGTTQIREPFNDLLEPVNIAFNFDSAMPVRRKWSNGLRCFSHCTTANLDSALDAQIQVGASLSVGPPARPLVSGTHGWSDKGDLQNRANGYLGDRRYSVDERLGDVVLVATARYGEGKVIVFGDTTTFQNSAAARGGDYVEVIFRWLSEKENARLAVSMRLILAVVMAGALWWLLRARVSNLGLVTSLFGCIYLGYAAGSLAGRSLARGLVSAPAPGDAVIDASHLSRCDPELWWPDGLGGVVQNLMRKNYVPQVMPQFSPELVRRCKLAFLVAPAKPFSRDELEVYEQFVRDGGELFVCLGYEDSFASGALLQRFGLRLRNLPLGQIGPEANDARVHLLNAWPIVAEVDGTEVVCRQGDYPLIVARQVGKGRVVLIGDSGFFLNRNLEMAEAFNLQNIEFFRRLVPAHE